MPKGMSTQVLGGFKTGMDRQSKRGGRDGAQRLYTLQNAYLNERGDAVPRPGLQHVAAVANSTGLYGWQGQLHVFHGEPDFVDPGNPLVAAHWVRYPFPAISISGGVPDGYVGTPVRYQYTISGGNPAFAANLAASITAGLLPAGLSMDSKGLVTGTPTTQATYSWDVTALNGDTLHDSATIGAPYPWTFVYGANLSQEIGRLANPRLDTAHSLVLAVSNTAFYSSTDGKTWTPTTAAFPTSSQGRGVAATTTAWFGLGNDGANASRLYRSTNQGASWSELLYAGAPMTWVDTIAAYDNVLLAMGYLSASDGAYFVVSQDNGATWAKVNVPAGWNPGDSILPLTVIYVPTWDQWIIPGQGVLYTADGKVPTSAVVAVASTTRIGSCAYSPLLDTVVVWGDALYTKATKAGVWTGPTTITKPTYAYEVIWNEKLSLFVANAQTKLLYSADAVTWTLQDINLASGGTAGCTAQAGCLYLPWTTQMVLCHSNLGTYNMLVSSP